jgi:hypothetical protein
VDAELLRALGRAQQRDEEDAMNTATTGEQTNGAELQRPLDDRERAAVLDGMFEEIDRKAAVVPPASRGRNRWIAIVGAAVAIAAALVLWIAWPRGSTIELPRYAITELRGGAAEVRSDPRALDRTLVLRRGDPIAVVVTPERPGTAALSIWLLAHGGGEPVMAKVDAMVASSGAVKIEGPIDRWLTLAPGEWTIDVLVAPADAAPTSADEAQRDAHVRRASFKVRIQPEE